MASFRDLIVWQKAMQLVTEVYQISKLFPKEEIYALTSQLRRCAISVPSNIAEGYARNSSGDYARYLRIANGSLYELETQVEIAKNLNYLSPTVCDMTVERSREIGRMLGSLIKKVEQSSRSQAKPAIKPLRP